jgi:hypothetical protein
MKRFMTIVSVLAVLSLAGSAFAEYEYGWTVSNSPTDPLANTGASTPGIVNYYLWFYCSTTDGMSAAEFNGAATGGIIPLAFTATNGFLNAGGATNLLLAVGGCPLGPVSAGFWLCQEIGPGELCIVPAGNGNNVTVDCRTSPAAWDNDVRGFSSVGEPCGVAIADLCLPQVSVEDESWGSIKGLYR